MPTTELQTQKRSLLASLRPHRADAARNFDAILAAARRVFVDSGEVATMPEVAAAAGVGVATVYRSFPTRDALIEAAYVAEVDELCESTTLAGHTPEEALMAWLTRFLEYMMTKRVLADGLNRSLEDYQATASYKECRTTIYETGDGLLRAAQDAGAARTDVDVDTILRFVMAISLGRYRDAAQRDAILAFALDALRHS